jgi:hypothetical protein
MNIDKHATIARLRSAIRSQESASRELRQEINALRVQGPSSGQARCNLNVRRKALGGETRVLLLALAMVLGRPYASQESTARDVVASLAIARDALGIDLYVKGSWKRTAEYDLAAAACPAITAWVKGGPSPVVEAVAVAA